MNSTNKTTAAMTKAKAENAILDAKRLCAVAGFDPDGVEDGAMVYTSRDGGNGTDCVPYPSTVRAARDLVAKLKGLGLQASSYTCDEWVSVEFKAS